MGYDTNVSYDRRRLATEVVSSDSEGEQVAREVLRRGSRDSRDSDYFLTEIRNRVDAITAERDHLDRLRRRQDEGRLGLGVTNYPERRQETSLNVRPLRERQEIRRQPREESQRDYRRELDRLWGLSPRREGSRDRDSRRKRKRPSRFQREESGGRLSFRDEVLGNEPGGQSPRPLDLSVTEVTPGHKEPVSIDLEPGPSTSRGHSSGLTRLVIPDSGSEDSDAENNTLVVDDDEEEMNKTLKRARARRMAREIVEDILGNVTKPKRVRPQEADIHISEEVTSSYQNMETRETRARKEPTADNSEEAIPSWDSEQDSRARREPVASTSSNDQTFTSQVLNNFLASQMHQNSLPRGFGIKYNIFQPNQNFLFPCAGYYTEGAQAYLSELSGMVQFQQSSTNTTQAQDMDEDENSDLEVVDIVSARPSRQPQVKDPEVVELLSDSEEEAEAPVQEPSQPGGGDDDDVVLVISSDDEDTSHTTHSSYIPLASANQPHGELVIIFVSFNLTTPDD